MACEVEDDCSGNWIVEADCLSAQAIQTTSRRLGKAGSISLKHMHFSGQHCHKTHPKIPHLQIYSCEVTDTNSL